MDQFIQTQSNIPGSYSGNQNSNNIFSSINNNTVNNTYVLPNTAGFGVGTQSNESAAGAAVGRPYRLIPYGRNSDFTGRQNLLESVKRFSDRKGHNRIALYGLGGSGKTQVALESVYQLAAESDRDIFWVQGSGILKFREGFRAVAQHAQIYVATAMTDDEDFLLGVRRWFEGQKSGDWILVIDNADNEADFVANNSPIAKFIPQGTKGTLVFTTRSRQVASRQGCKMIEVAKMVEEEALELFSKRFGTWDTLEDEEKKATAMILASVDYLPLAVVGSAAFMTETGTPPSDYWAIFQENEDRIGNLLSQEFSDIRREADMTESILGTYFVTFDRIRQQMPGAAHILWLMAFFDRQNIPEELLSRCGLEGMDDSVEFRRAIGKLFGFSLVTIVKRGNNTFYELHRLVQLSLQVYLPTEDLNQWRATALKVVSRCFPQDESEWRGIGPAYIPHALAVTTDLTNPIAEELCFRMGRYFLDMGSYGNAETQFHRCILLGEDCNEGDWDEEGLGRLWCLGEAKFRQGKYDEAEEMNRRAMEGCEKVLGPGHPHTLSSVNHLAVVLDNQGRYDESETMHRRALEGREKVLGPDHPDTLSSVNNLAAVLDNQGRYNESETMHRRALEGYEKVLGPDHPHTLSSINNLALVLDSQGRYNESETMHRRALEVREKVLGPDHPDTLSSVNHLAVVLGNQGKHNESEPMHRRALEGREKVLGPDHPDTLSSVNNLAMVLNNQGRYNESKTMHRRALEGREKVLGPDHPETLSSINNLALVLDNQGKYNESETMHRRALEVREKVLGPDHPDTLSSVNNLAVVLGNQGRYNESEPMHRRALEGYEKVLGPDHPNTLSSVNNLAVVLDNQGKYNESETMHRRALEVREKVLGPDHPDTLSSVNNLATVLDSQGRYDESETMHRRALEVREKVLGPDHPGTLSSVNNLAMMLDNQGKYNESETLHRRAMAGFEKVLGQDHPHTRTCAANLASVRGKQKASAEQQTTSQSTQSSLPMRLGRTGLRSTGRRVRRFLEKVVSKKDVGRAK